MHRSLHERLKELREVRGFKTQKLFCAYASRQGVNLSLRRFGALERGEAKPSPEEVVYICKALGITTDAWLIGDNNTLVISGLGERGRKALLRIADEIKDLDL